MNEQLPLEYQMIDVCLDNHDWQPATYQHGEFVDIYGLPLNRDRISGWRPSDRSAPEIAPQPRHRGWVLP